MLGVSVATVRRWRSVKHGPRYLKLGALCKYKIEDCCKVAGIEAVRRLSVRRPRKMIVPAALRELDGRYSDAVVKVDTTSSIAARICKAYATVTRIPSGTL